MTRVADRFASVPAGKVPQTKAAHPLYHCVPAACPQRARSVRLSCTPGPTKTRAWADQSLQSQGPEAPRLAKTKGLETMGPRSCLIKMQESPTTTDQTARS